MDTNKVTSGTAEGQAELACSATRWFQGCTSSAEVEARLEQHKNACRWEVLSLNDIREAKDEYRALSRILAKAEVRSAHHQDCISRRGASDCNCASLAPKKDAEKWHGPFHMDKAEGRA